MSISPPSDIVLDVARAADPVRYKEAAERLHQLSFGQTQASLSADAASAFDSALADAADVPALAPLPIIQMPFDAVAAMTRLKTDTALSSGMTVPSAGGSAETFRTFEAMFLANFVETMLPKQSDAIFGAGSAGQIWRSMLAEQIAAQMADGGGVGIADQLRKSSAETPAPAQTGGGLA